MTTTKTTALVTPNTDVFLAAQKVELKRLQGVFDDAALAYEEAIHAVREYANTAFAAAKSAYEALKTAVTTAEKAVDSAKKALADKAAGLQEMLAAAEDSEKGDIEAQIAALVTAIEQAETALKAAKDELENATPVFEAAKAEHEAEVARRQAQAEALKPQGRRPRSLTAEQAHSLPEWQAMQAALKPEPVADEPALEAVEPVAAEPEPVADEPVGPPTTLRQLLTSPAVVKTIVLRDVTVACSANGCKTEMAGDRADVIVFCDPEHLFLERPLNFNRQTGRHDDFPLLDWNCGREYRTAVKSGVMKGGVVLNIHDVLKRFRKNEEQFGGLEAVLKDEEARHSAAYLANTPLSQITAQFMDEDLQGWRESADSVFEQTSDACAALWAAIEAKSADLKRQLSADEVRDLPQWQAYEDAAKGLCHVRGIPEHKVNGILARAEAPSIDPELITPWVVGLWNGNETEYLVLPERQARMAAYLRYVGFCAQKGNVIGFSDYCRKYAGLQPLLALRAALRAVEAAKLAKIEASRVTLATKFQGLGKLVETIRAASEDAPVVLDKHDGRRDHRGGRDRRHSAGN